MKHVKNFDGFLNEANGAGQLMTLPQDMKVYVETKEGSDPEPGEIDSLKSGYDAIVKAMGVAPDKIVSLLKWDDDQDGHIITGHPDLECEDPYSKFYSKLPKVGKEIWQDEIWSGTPDSNQIHVYELPAEDGGTVKLAVWTGAGWDEPHPYMLASDLKRRLK